jgi:hypothetical protein
MPTQIRATTEPLADRPRGPRLAALTLVLAVVAGLGLAASPPDDAQVLSTPDCGPTWVVDDPGHVWADDPSC